MDTLAKSLLEAQKNMPPMEKDAQNPHYKTAFTSLDYIVTHARPVWVAAGLSVTQWPSFDAVSGRHTLTTKVMDASSGEAMEEEMLLNIGKDDMQALGAAITYARRYALSSIFALATETDDDGNSTAKPKRSAHGNAEPKAGEAEKPKTSRAASPANGAKRDPKYATQDQTGRLWALAQANGVDEPALRAIIRKHTGQESGGAIPKEKYDAVCVSVQTYQLATALATGTADDVPFE